MFGRKSASSDFLENRPVRDALAKLNADPSEENRIAFYRALKSGLLILGVRELPPGMEKGGPVTLEADLPVQCMTTEAPGGGGALLAFTERESLAARNPDGVALAFESAAVLRMVSQGYDGLLVNPAGPWAGVPVADVDKILDGAW